MNDNLFDAGWYLHTYQDVAAAVRAGQTDAWTHFLEHGRYEGRSPSHVFDPDHYLARNPDIKDAVEAGLTTAYDHFIQYGQYEGRSFLPYLDLDFYLKANPDVAQAVANSTLTVIGHFLAFGQFEARPFSPFFHMADYLAANADVADAVEKSGSNAAQHLLFYGYGESRSLGNGIHLDQFANDPVFQQASTAFEKLARVAEVGPFLPTFIPPEGWEAPADTPIPIDFIPVPGEKLVVPPSVTIPDGMELPDTFEPVEPEPEPEPEPQPDPDPEPDPQPDPDPQPEPEPEPGPGPGPGPDPEPDPEPEPQAFEAYMDEDGVIRFLNVKNQEVEFTDIALKLSSFELLFEFESGGQRSYVEQPLSADDPDDWFGLLPPFLGTDFEFEWDDDADPVPELKLDPAGFDALLEQMPPVRIELQADETLAARPELLWLTAVNKVYAFGLPTSVDDSQITFRVDQSADPAPEAQLSFTKTFALAFSDLKDGVDMLHLNLNDAIVALAPNSEYNLLTYDSGDDAQAGLKSLSIQTSGSRNYLDLANDKDFNIGYALGDVQVAGSGLLALFSLYLGEEGTTFDALDHRGSVVLHAHVDTAYTHNPHSADDYGWNIRFGDGHGALMLTAIGNESSLGNTGGYLDGGGGISVLELDSTLYEMWKNPGPDGGPVIKNFDILFTEAVDGEVYKSTLLGNKFHTLSLHSDNWGSPSSPSVSVAEGFTTVGIGGDMEVDVSALKGSRAEIRLEQDILESVTVRVAALDLDEGNKSDLDGLRQSDMSIVLPDEDCLDGIIVTVENMTISRKGDSSEVVQNDTIDFSAWGGKAEFIDMVLNFTVSEGEQIEEEDDSSHYMDFTLEFDFYDSEVRDFTLVLQNVVTETEYDEMVSGVDPDEIEITLLGILIDEGTFIL